MTGSNEIRDPLFSQVNASNTQAARTSAPPRTEQQPHSPTTDSVTLSLISQELDSVQEAISQLPEIRIERVEQVRQSLNAGTYRVSSELVADRIIQETVRNSR